MNNEIKKWQDLWQEKKSTPIDINKLINNINKIEKKANIERKVLLIAIPIMLVVLATIFPVFSNIYYSLFVSLMGIGMLTILFQSFRSKMDKADNEAINNQKYVTTVVEKLKQRIALTSRYMWFYAVVLILGLNIGYLDILTKFNLSLIAKIATHIVLTTVMFYLMYYGIKNKEQKNKIEIQPLIEILNPNTDLKCSR